MEIWNYFSSQIYNDFIQEYLESTILVADEHLNLIKKDQSIDKIYPIWQSNSFENDNRIINLRTEIIKKSEFFLDSQGYDISSYDLFFTELWAQEHHKTSNQERHVHHNTVLSGVYFLQCPEDGCRFIIHEPRPAKEYGIFLPEKNVDLVTQASTIINFTPEPGELMLFNSYLPHSFTRNGSDIPCKFIHFNIGARYRETQIV